VSKTGFFVRHDQVVLGERIREDYKGKDWKEYKASFLTLGQMQPIVVEQNGNGKYVILYGERRWRAIGEHYAEGSTLKDVPHGEIWAATRDNLPRHTKLLLEFGENQQRSDFTHVEKAKFIREFHDLMVEEKGEVWTQELTAHVLNLSPASISHYLRIEEAMKTDPSVAKATTLDAAVKRMKVTEKLNKRHQEAKKTDDSNSYERATSILHHGDARDWIVSLDDGSVDLINFDPPWGGDVSHKVQENHEGFDDSTEYAESLMETMLPQLFRVLKDDRFCIFWFRSWADESMAALAQRHGFNLDFTRTACIWYKPDKIVDQNRIPEKSLVDGYEKFFILRKGNPIFHERRGNNVFAYNRVPLGQIIHPTEKPVDLCQDIIRLCSVPGELVLDTCAGSSAFLDAGLRINRKAKGCELAKTYWERGITRLSEYLRTFKEA
jgi:ParB/RepB/Spo0J family partition protein